jgi:2-oxoglutarate ferredoxin oxidoreductase subunit beta
MEPIANINGMEVVYKKPQTLTEKPTHYCPGCGHGVVHKILMEVIDELGIQEETIGVAPEYMNIDMQEAAHGRASAVATGIKRVLPNKYVFSYQGDGDLAAIGTGETIHTVNRGENILMLFINNGIYGMTGGQMAPTSLIGMKTTTTPFGREASTMGNPIKITELIAQLPGAYFVTRHSVHNTAAIRKLKKAIEASFKYQKLNKGTCFIEVVSNCPSQWKMTPVESNQWLEKNMFPFYPLGDIKIPKS